MKSDAPVAPGFASAAVRAYERQTGQPPLAWLLVAAANLAFQLILYFEITPDHARAGEFGIFNSALGLIGLLTVPLLALHVALRLYPALSSTNAEKAERIRTSSVVAVESTTWVWGAICCVIILVPLPLLYLPRFSLQLLVLMNVLVALGSILSRVLYESENQFRRWATLLVIAAFTRTILVSFAGSIQPWADTALLIFLIAGFITFGPALRPRDIEWTTRLAKCRAVLDRDFLVFAGAVGSVFLGVYLFTNGDRIAALRWVDIIPHQNIRVLTVDKGDFDRYQLAGLLARALLWGTMPLLWILYADRVGLKKTTSASLRAFWVYLAVLIGCAFALGLLTEPWPGSPTVNYVGRAGPTFAAIMVPLGLLQGLGVFALASGRLPECYTLGACGVVYALVLVIFGSRPDFMLPLMFGLSLIALMILLFVGVVRWGRKQP